MTGEQVVGDAVTRRLEAELAARGLLLRRDAVAAAEEEAARSGARLLGEVMSRCYPTTAGGVELEFESDAVAARLAAALAFGAATARVLAQTPPAAPAEVLCATFNLGIGLVDGICDGDAELGVELLDLVRRHGLVEAAHERKGRGWLRGALPAVLAHDATTSFTVDVVETFFETLHDVYAGGGWVRHRRRVGEQLEAALEAERRSVAGAGQGSAPEQLLEASRLTSVLPFQIIETLAAGDRPPAAPTAGTLLGEAMWRIDDLVDLSDDARTGAANAILLAAGEAAVERMADSPLVARAAAEAADALQAGLRLAAGVDRAAGPDHAATGSFLYFVQEYAGISPPPPS